MGVTLWCPMHDVALVTSNWIPNNSKGCEMITQPRNRIKKIVIDKDLIVNWRGETNASCIYNPSDNLQKKTKQDRNKGEVLWKCGELSPHDYIFFCQWPTPPTFTSTLIKPPKKPLKTKHIHVMTKNLWMFTCSQS